MTRLQESLCAGAAGSSEVAGVVAEANTLDSVDEDSDSESDGDELPEVGLFDPIGDMGGPRVCVAAATSSSLSDKPRSLLTTSGDTELLEFGNRLSKPGFIRGVLISCTGFSWTLFV